jgi:predicted nucleotidyltransferase component of viral defense system
VNRRRIRLCGNAVVSFPDLYAGKLVAALDRQYPRDLFDVRDLIAHEGVNDKLRNAFIVHLLSPDRANGRNSGIETSRYSAEYTRSQRPRDSAIREDLLVTQVDYSK